MRKIFLALTIAFSFPALTDEKTDLRTLETDFAILCETSKMATALAKTKTLDAADLAERISAMLESGLRSKEVRTARSGIAQASAKDRKALWEKAAQEVGLKKWKCATVGNL